MFVFFSNVGEVATFTKKPRNGSGMLPFADPDDWSTGLGQFVFSQQCRVRWLATKKPPRIYLSPASYRFNLNR